MKDIFLEKPQKELDVPLMQAIENRRTKRKWTNETLTLQEISNICWVACGETKAATKRSKNMRTVASGCNSQIVSIYIALDSGVYKYIEKEHKLSFITSADVRGMLGTQKMMKSAVFGIIYVADFSTKTGILKSDYSKKMFIAGTETGLMSQNVYLYCSATDLNTVLIALIDRDNLAKTINLNENSEITFTQIVGKPL